MHPQLYYQIYRVERGLTAPEQRAADVRSGELAAALAALAALRPRPAWSQRAGRRMHKLISHFGSSPAPVPTGAGQ
jgi:hypothetical protein